MRRDLQEIKDKSVIDKILSTSEICRLGFIDNDRAYILPFNYGYQDGFIYIHCAKEGKKIDLIKKNNLVCFEVEQIAGIERYDKACKWATTYRSVIGYGKVEIITDYEQKRKGLDVIMKHNGADSSHDLDYEKSKVDLMLILKVEITELTGKQSGNLNERYQFIAEHRGGPLTKENHRKLIRWARECSEHVLYLSGNDIDKRLLYALDVARQWENGAISTGDAMKASLGAHAVAREAKDPIYKAIARSVGQTVAAAHMADHSTGGAFYALKAVKLANLDVRKEREWQIQKLKELPSELTEIIQNIWVKKEFDRRV